MPSPFHPRIFALVLLALMALARTAMPQTMHDHLEFPGILPTERPQDGPPRSAWLDGNWSYRAKITICPDSIEGTGDLIDFPVAVPLDGGRLPGIFAYAKNDGSDLVITKHDGLTLTDHELVSFDALGQAAEVWFRADTLSRNKNIFYLYYGNPDTTIVTTAGAVWGEAHLAVYHFEEDPASGLLWDYGPGGNHAIPRNGWTSADTSSGAIGQAWKYNGTTHWVDGDAISSPDSSFTISAWFGLHDLFGGTDFAFQSQQGFWHLSAKRHGLQRNPDFGCSYASVSWFPEPIPDSLLHHYAWVMDGEGDTLRFFFDGVEQDIRLGSAPYPPYKIYTGNQIGGNVGIASPCYYNTYDLMAGLVDEFRVYEGIQTPERIRTEFRNQAGGEGFLQFEEEQYFSGVVTIDTDELDRPSLGAFPNPFHGRTAITLRLPRAASGQFVIYDMSGRRVRTIPIRAESGKDIRQFWNGQDDRGLPLGSGTYLLRAETSENTIAGRVLLLR
jgi:hypothetical protein